MASIQERRTKAGVVHRVLFRHGGRQTSMTFPDGKSALKAKQLIETLGPDEAVPRLEGRSRASVEVPTVADWMERHVADLTGITDRTRADYRRLVARHITPALGALDVDEVTPADIAKWANQLEQTLGAKTIANLRALLSAAFGYAVDERLRSDNPLRRLRRSRAKEHEREDMVCLTPQEFLHLRSFLPEHWRPFATFLAGTGLRFGEAVALQVRDVDLLAETPAVSVTKAWRRTDKGFEVGPPKSRKSRRTVSLSDDVVDVLAPLVTRPGDELLFTNPHGNRVLHANMWNRVWKPAVSRFAGDVYDEHGKLVERGHGKRPRIHDLRHTHASLLIAKGVHLEVIRDRLGHENISTTSGVYSHLMPDQHRLTAAALDGLLVDEDVR